MIRKVLVVDDDQIMLLAIEKKLAAFSDYFTVILASDGFEAVKKLAETSVSLIVLDLIMPRMDGMSLLNHVREKYPDIPAIIISAGHIEQMQTLAGFDGVIGCFDKPFSMDALAEKIMAFLREEADGGIMHNVSPSVFLQLMEMDAKTCTIHVYDNISRKGGVLYFVDGQLVDARIAQLRGIEAAYEVFTYEEVTIFIRNECEPRENIINSGLQPIILKAVGMKDESGDTALAVGEGGDKVFFSPEDIRELLNRELGEKCEITDISIATDLGVANGHLAELGALAGFGSLKGSCLFCADSTKIVLPGNPATVLTAKTDCPHDDIIRVLGAAHKKNINQSENR